MAGPLDDRQLSTFRDEGYLVLPQAFDAAEVRRMRQEADHILGLIINSSLANRRRSGRLDILEGSNGLPMVRKIQPINDLSLFLAQISQDERLVSPMRQIMGDEPMLMEEKLNYKQPLLEPVVGIETRKHDDRFPIHNDWAYYKAQNYPQSLISSAICIDDLTPDSGPLHVWPGSHHSHLEHEATDIGWQVMPGAVDFEGGVDILCPAGSVLLFHVLIVHNSRPNTSGRPRRVMIYTHFPEQTAMGFDVRNGPTRLRESAWEWEYARTKDRGEYQDVFHAPVA